MSAYRLYATWLQRRSGIFALAALLVLTACGGGSGAPNNPFAPSPPTPDPLVVNPPSATIYTQVASTLTVSGGVPPYRAFSSNSAVLPVAQNLPANTVTLLAGNVTASTFVTITLQDSAGTQATADITILPGPATPPPPIAVLPSPVDIFSGIPTQLTVSGGVPPYQAFSSAPTLLPVTQIVGGNTVNLIANDVTASTGVTVTIRDSVGQTTPVSVTVRPKQQSAQPLAVLPSTVVTGKGILVTLTISGGLPPYNAYSSNPTVIPVNKSVTGSTLVITASSVTSDTSVAITIQDSAGQTAQVAVTVQPAVGPPLAVLPPSAVIFSNVPTSITVTGGAPPYQAFSSNPTILPVAQSVSGSAIPLLATNVSADTTVTLTVQDSAGATSSAAITVRASTLLNALTITPNLTECGTQAICSGQSGTAAVTLQLPGGGPAPGRQVRFDVIAGPYSIAVNGSSPTAPSQVAVSDAAGVASVIIRANVDAPTQPAQIRATDIQSGQQLTANFLILQRTDGSTILTVVPTEATINATYNDFCTFGVAVDYYIYGGTPPYRVTSNFGATPIIVNPLVTVSGGFVEVITDGTCLNPVTLSIVDATGRQTTAKLFNLTGTATRPVTTPPDLVVVPDNLSANCDAGVQVQYVITGGTPGYSATISPRTQFGNPSVSPSIVNSSGGSFTVTGLDGDGGTRAADAYVVSFVDSSRPPKTLNRTITCNE